MNQNDELTRRLELIESGYEFLLAYAAQGRADDAGSPVRDHLAGMHSALEELLRVLDDSMGDSSAPHGAGTRVFFKAVGRDADIAQGAIGFVLDQPAISSSLVDNLNASIHLRALLTDLFLIDQARKGGAATASSRSR
jgi:hypothetical protein